MRSELLVILFFLASLVDAQSCEKLQVVFIIGVVFGAFALIYTYQRTQTSRGLDAEIIKKRKILKRLQSRIEGDKALLDKQKRMLFDFGVDDVAADEVKKRLQDGKTVSSVFSKKFWSKIEGEAGTADAGELSVLIEKKQELERLIEMSRVKYHKREIDEANFNEITKDYQKQLIELEHRIKKIQEE